jgi:hypothetical protein
LAEAISGVEPNFRDSDFWISAGKTKLDRQLTQLADLYIEASSEQKEEIRSSVAPRAEWNLVAFVRRLAVHLLDDLNPLWLKRGLAIACVENGRFDFRDTITSLVILRAAAEQAGIDPLPYFDNALSHCDHRVEHMIENARNYKPSDMRYILRECGPSELKPKRRKKTS